MLFKSLPPQVFHCNHVEKQVICYCPNHNDQTCDQQCDKYRWFSDRFAVVSSNTSLMAYSRPHDAKNEWLRRQAAGESITLYQRRFKKYRVVGGFYNGKK